MRALAPTAAALLLAGAAQAQTAPQTPPADAPASALTFDLNSGPPRPAEYLTPPPAPTPAPTTAAEPAPPATSVPPESTARPDRERFVIPEPFVAPREAPARIAPIPAEPPAAPRTGPITPERPPDARVEPLAPPARTAPPIATPAPETGEPAPARPAAGVTVLDAAARAALPFTVELPAGFEMVTGRPGPDFRIYTIRRGDRSFVMVYAGPASQFPIYTGETVEAGGRASVVVTEQGARHAVEHLFQRSDAPREIHVWTMTLDGADRALAERIAQSVDVRQPPG